MPLATPYDLIRPLVWIAVGAFFVGFAIFLVVAAALRGGGELRAQAEPPAWTVAAPENAPAAHPEAPGLQAV